LVIFFIAAKLSFMKFTPQDQQFMRRALELARRGTGQTSPNPVVGAVLVRAGKIIGEGWHKFAGGPHAEINALQGQDAHRATLYVTLEPCSTHGRTPPCTDAIIAAGVRRVVVAATDPNPRHLGRGIKLLRKAGIKVEDGLLAEEATGLNEAFNKWITTGQPLVIAKAAFSVDGKMATRTGDSKWITSESARQAAHRLRAGVDAVIVGANTVLWDNPQLTLRHGVQGRQPWRVVVDGRGNCRLDAKLFTDAFRSRTIAVTTKESSEKWRRELALSGVVVLMLPGKDGRVEMGAILREMGRMEVTSVLVEGGRELLERMFDADVVDRVAFFYSPKIIAGKVKVADAAAASGQWKEVSGTGEMIFEGRLQ
jgi:diaminohydroxyphosphoribosylaminopyrimidine deaminase / 5-amino-6-(5-phosphoribosylamino)uracil reductase